MFVKIYFAKSRSTVTLILNFFFIHFHSTSFPSASVSISPNLTWKRIMSFPISWNVGPIAYIERQRLIQYGTDTSGIGSTLAANISGSTSTSLNPEPTKSSGKASCRVWASGWGIYEALTLIFGFLCSIGFGLAPI